MDIISGKGNSLIMLYVIVKNAANWEHYFDSDPKEGVHPSYSSHDTYTGIQADCQSSYVSMNKAQEMKEKMLQLNSCGGYEVCPIAQ